MGSAKYQCGQARWGGGQWRVVESQLEALLNGRTAPRDCWLPSVLMFPCTPTSARLSMSTNLKTPVFLTIIWLFLQASLPIFPCLEVLLLLLGYLEKVPNSRVWLLESYQNKFWAHHNKFWAHQNKFWSEKKRHCSRMSSELIRRDWNWRLQRRHRARAGPCTGTDPGTGTNLIILEGVAPNIYWLSVFGVLFTPFCMQIFSLRIVY